MRFYLTVNKMILSIGGSFIIGLVNWDGKTIEVETVKLNRVAPFDNRPSTSLSVKMFWRYFWKRITQLVSQSFNYNGVFRTAPATPGVLNPFVDVT